jgi:hypothetical protein
MPKYFTPTAATSFHGHRQVRSGFVMVMPDSSTRIFIRDADHPPPRTPTTTSVATPTGVNTDDDVCNEWLMIAPNKNPTTHH